MKINIYSALVFSLIFAGFTSCKKGFLNVVPEGQKVASTTEDYRLLMADPGLSRFTSAGGWQGQVLMGDEVAVEAQLFNQAVPLTLAAFKWADQMFRLEDRDPAINSFLANLYQVNKVINEVQASKGGTAQQKNEVQALAQANRAWMYFQLINFYGKPYLATSAATDPGFPIIVTADITENEFKRATVQQVYDFIIKDFTSAIPNLPLNPDNGAQFSQSAAQGLLGKVYLFMGRNREALDAFDKAFERNAARAKPARLYNYVTEFALGGKFTPMNPDGPNNAPGNNRNDFTESLVSMLFYNGSYAGNGFENDAMVLDPKARILFKSSDLRLNFYAPQFPYNVPNPSGRLRKIGVTYSRFGLEISDLYLLRAEAKARLNDLPGAVADVEVLRGNRMPAADVSVPGGVATTGTALIKYIFDERIREFAMEGYRWFDMRRQSVDPLFSGQTHTHTLYDFEAGTSTEFVLKPVRLTMRLPLIIMEANPGMENNP